MDDTDRVIRLLGALMSAWLVAGLTGCAAQPAPTPAGPEPPHPAPSESPASDACAALTAADVTAAIAALPGWSYDYWSSSETTDGTPQDTGSHSRAEYVAPDRLREVAWDPAGAPRGSIIIGDRMWVYTNFPDGFGFDRADFPTWLERRLPFMGSFVQPLFGFKGDLPGGGLRASPRVGQAECLATDPDSGTSLVTTRSGQLVRITSEKRSGKFIEQRALIFHATPPAIEPPSAEELRPNAIYHDSG